MEPIHCIYMLYDIKKTIWATADKLRANMDAAEYKHLVLGLIFVKYISDILGSVSVVMPSREVVIAFEEIVSGLEARRAHNVEQAQTLATLRDTLLPRLISVQLRLPEAQAATAEALAN